MPRNLDTSAATQAASKTPSPIIILEINFPAPLSTRYYTSRETTITGLNVEPRLVECGQLQNQLAQGMRIPSNNCHINLRDDDSTLRTILDTTELQGLGAVVYMYFEGLPPSGMTPLLSGVIGGGVKYTEATATLEFDVTDISRKWDMMLGQICSRDSLPNIAPSDEGKMLPIVVGNMKRSKTIQAASSRIGTLLKTCTKDDNTLYISGFEDLPPATPLTIEIGRERITGTISGTMLSVTSRGGGTIASGTVTHSLERQTAMRDSNLTGFDNEYYGYCLLAWISADYLDGDISYDYRYTESTARGEATSYGYEYRVIFRFDASTGTIEYWPPFSVEGTRSDEETPYIITGTGHVKLLRPGDTYLITTIPASHAGGERVTEVIAEGWKYILNDAPSKSVDNVYLYGRRIKNPLSIRGQTTLLGGGTVGSLEGNEYLEEEPVSNEPGWLPIDSELYEVNLNDTTSFPDLPNALTTVTFRRDPLAMPNFSFRSRELRADISGLETNADSTGTLVQNPADVIKSFLTRFGGLDATDDIDAPSFTTATSTLTNLRMAFTLSTPTALPQFIADLAFQARSSIGWDTGKIGMRVLPIDSGISVLTLNAIDRKEGSMVLGWDDEKELFSAVKAKYIQNGEPRELALADTAAVDNWGYRLKTISLFAYNETELVREITNFWLWRYALIRRRIKLRTFLQTMSLVPGDVVSLSAPELGSGSFNCEVENVRHIPGSSVDDRIDQIELDMRLPIEAGCENSCELGCEVTCQTQCESTSCETSCEFGCEAVCETGCQSTCELDCAAASEALCQSACMAVACEVACEVIIMSTDGWSCGACESACQIMCESSCETSCEASCESMCESGTES